MGNTPVEWYVGRWNGSDGEPRAGIRRLRCATRRKILRLRCATPRRSAGGRQPDEAQPRDAAGSTGYPRGASARDRAFTLQLMPQLRLLRLEVLAVVLPRVDADRHFLHHRQPVPLDAVNLLG